MQWCAAKELARLSTSPATVVGFNLVFSRTKLKLTILAFPLKFSLNKVHHNDIQYARHFQIFHRVLGNLGGGSNLSSLPENPSTDRTLLSFL